MKYVKDKEVLNCFSYTGGFGLYALKGDAKRVINADVSQPALDTAKLNAELNEFDISKKRAVFLNADVFKLLREYRDQGTKFDVVIMDPPKFAESKAQINGACRGYKDINMLAMQILKPGGTLLTYSCSGLMTKFYSRKSLRMLRSMQVDKSSLSNALNKQRITLLILLTRKVSISKALLVKSSKQTNSLTEKGLTALFFNRVT